MKITKTVFNFNKLLYIIFCNIIILAHIKEIGTVINRIVNPHVLELRSVLISED